MFAKVNFVVSLVICSVVVFPVMTVQLRSFSKAWGMSKTLLAQAFRGRDAFLEEAEARLGRIHLSSCPVCGGMTFLDTACSGCETRYKEMFERDSFYPRDHFSPEEKEFAEAYEEATGECVFI